MDQQLRILIGVALDPAGKLVMFNSTANQIEAYGLLEVAKDNVRDAAKAAAGKPHVVAPPPGVNGQRLRITEP